jgi:hypothetical protein
LPINALICYGTFRASQFTNNGSMTFSGGASTINGNVTRRKTNPRRLHPRHLHRNVTNIDF